MWLYSVFLLAYTLGLASTHRTKIDFADSISQIHICEKWIRSPNWTNITSCVKKGRSFFCFGEAPDLLHWKQTKLRKVENVTFCGWPNRVFDSRSLKNFPSLEALHIHFGQLKEFSHDFPILDYLQVVQITNTSVSYIHPTLFKEVDHLKYLDLRKNRIHYVEGPLVLNKDFREMRIAGNPINCTKNHRWMLNTEKAGHIVDRDLLYCNDHKYSGRHLMSVMQFKQTLRNECSHHPELKNCTCNMHYVRRSDDGKSLTPIFAVNCSHLNLHHFPSYLPKNTTIFYATDNQISHVRSLRNNPVYRAVHDVYLDNNNIETIDYLEAGFWLHNFRVFSLKGNKLEKLPVYALDDALEQNHQAAKLYLSGNPWLCDCKFTLRFRELLMKYESIIKDSANVTCKYVEGDNNFLTQVLSLKKSNVCRIPMETRLQPLDLLNGILALLIIFVLGKLAYDYYHYRIFGRLPWIVTKLP